MRRVPVWAMASSTLAVPPMFIWRSTAQAQCTTTSVPATARRTSAASRISLCTKSACARPTFGSTTGQTDDLVAPAEQSGDNAATDHSARPGDRDSHWLTSNLIWLVVVVEEVQH